jgi:hypothetical protein
MLRSVRDFIITLFNLSSNAPAAWNCACVSSLQSSIASPRVDHPRRDGKFESEAGGGKRNFGHLVGDLNWKAVLYSVWDAHENF